MNASELARIWAPLLPSAAIEILSPWQEVITGLRLVSDYWQPQLNIFCTALGAISVVTTFAMLRGRSKRSQRVCAIVSIVPMIIAVLLCLAISLSLGTTYFPEGTTRVAVWIGWITAYLLIFLSLGALLGALSHLLQRPKPKKKAARSKR